MRSFLRTLRTSLRALRRNILRTGLTCLGIIIGVAAVIAMMEIGGGSSSAIQKTIASMGADVVLIQPGTAASGGVTYGAGSVVSLKPQDCDAIIKECPAVRAAAPVIRARVQLVYNNKNWVPFYMYGTTPAFLEVRDWTDLSDGASFTDQDVRNASKVCLLGQSTVRELFGDEDPIGKEIRAQNVSLKVVGVLSRKGASMGGFDQDDVVVMPWTTIKYRVSGSPMASVNQSAPAVAAASQVNSLNQLYPSQQTPLYPTLSQTQAADTPQPVKFASVDQIMAAAGSSRNIPVAVRQISALLHERHKIKEGELDDFTARDMAEMMKALTSTTSLMTTLLLSVACISLIVGGVGIMNIMLVSVTERTREIGLRMAVGARSGDILRQFLIEAVILCLLGGAIGIILGRGGSFLIHFFLHWPVEVSLLAISISVIVSAAVGIIFGFYPAFKASQLDPIEALRYE